MLVRVNVHRGLNEMRALQRMTPKNARNEEFSRHPARCELIPNWDAKMEIPVIAVLQLV